MAAAVAAAPTAHDPFGRVDPARPAPALALVGDDAKAFELPPYLRGRTTAVQLMFTGCSATCPIQGALFADIARRLPAGEVGLLSLSIDPLADDPRALRDWMRRFGSSRRWRAAAPRVCDVDTMLDFLRGRAVGADRHTTQVYLFDRRAQLVYRTPELPPPAHVVDLLTTLVARG